MSRKHNSLPSDQSVVSIRLPIELHEELKGLATANDRTVAQEVRRLIAQRVAEAQTSESAAA